MKIDKFKSLGLKQMHPMQVEALMNMVNISLRLASMIDDDDILEEVEAEANDLVQLFGGGGLRVKVYDF
jgi:Mg/Co/Ni transporter MgtE|tara:strand:+ start:2114 stop:2320 length:207 start_codon:yes stop_codon:yes gene_type:complete